MIYNLNPSDNYAFATMAGNFQDGSVAGKIQFGSGWWFLDQKEAMEWQLNALANIGLLGRFVGMLTDSRNFLCYPRHEYFRRVLCNLLGLPDGVGRASRTTTALVGGMVRRICFANARDYFGLELDPAFGLRRAVRQTPSLICLDAHAGGRTGFPSLSTKAWTVLPVARSSPPRFDLVLEA